MLYSINTKIAENLCSTVICTLHRIKVPEPVTVKSVVEELNKLNKRIKIMHLHLNKTIHLLLFIIIFIGK